MKLRPIAAALLVTFAPMALGAPNLQAQTADDPTTVAARARFKEGVALSEQGRFEDARAAFLQAYALKKHPDVLLNLADSCLKSNHTLEAERYFTQYLREAPDAKAEKRQAAERGRTEARGKLGRIEVSAPSGTEVTIDSDRAGTTPLDGPVYVEPGAHMVKFKGSDGTTDSQSVTVAAGQQQTARFNKGGTAPATTVTPVPTTPPTSTSTPPTTPPDSSATPPTTPPDTGTPDTGKKPSPLSPPDNMVPVYIGGGIAIVSFGVAIAVGIVAKGSAQDSANKVANDIRGHNPPSKVCGPPVKQSNFKTACDALTSDNNDVNTDATIGNVALAVGIIALVGTGIYYFVAPKKKKEGAAAFTTPVVSPILGPRVGGLSIGGSF